MDSRGLPSPQEGEPQEDEQQEQQFGSISSSSIKLLKEDQGRRCCVLPANKTKSKSVDVVVERSDNQHIFVVNDEIYTIKQGEMMFVQEMSSISTTTTNDSNNEDDDDESPTCSTRTTHDGSKEGQRPTTTSTSTTNQFEFLKKIVSSDAWRCKTLTLQGSSAYCCSSPRDWPLSQEMTRILQGAIVSSSSCTCSSTTPLLEEITIRGLDLDLPAILFIGQILKSNKVYGITFADNSWKATMVEFLVDILAAALAENTSLRSFKFLTSNPSSSSSSSNNNNNNNNNRVVGGSYNNNNNGGLSDRHLAKIIQTGFSNHKSLEYLELDNRNWHNRTLKAIGGLFVVGGAGGGADRCCSTLKQLILNRQKTSKPSLNLRHLFGGDHHHHQQQQQQQDNTIQEVSDHRHSTLLSSSTQLQVLALRACNLGNKDFQQLVSNTNLIWNSPSLVEVDLSGNRISSLETTNTNTSTSTSTRGGVHGCSFSRPSLVRRLNLTGNPVSPTRKVGRITTTTNNNNNNNNNSVMDSSSRQQQVTTTTIEGVGGDDWTMDRGAAAIAAAAAAATALSPNVVIVNKKEQLEHLERLLESNPLLGNLGGEEEDFNEESFLYTPHLQHLLDMNSSGGRMLLEAKMRPTTTPVPRRGEERDCLWRTSSRNTSSCGEVPLSLWPQLFGSCSGLEKKRSREQVIPPLDGSDGGSSGRSANAIYHLLRYHFYHGPSLFDHQHHGGMIDGGDGSSS